VNDLSKMRGALYDNRCGPAWRLAKKDPTGVALQYFLDHFSLRIEMEKGSRRHGQEFRLIHNGKVVAHGLNKLEFHDAQLFDSDFPPGKLWVTRLTSGRKWVLELFMHWMDKEVEVKRVVSYPDQIPFEPPRWHTFWVALHTSAGGWSFLDSSY